MITFRLQNFTNVVEHCLSNNTMDLSDPDYKQYHGRVAMEYYEELPDLEIPRSFLRPVDDALQFSIRFPVSATFFSDNQTLTSHFNNFTVFYAIVNQKITLNVPITGSYGTVILATLTKATFRLVNESISNTVSNLSPTITSAAGNGKYVPQSSNIRNGPFAKTDELIVAF